MKNKFDIYKKFLKLLNLIIISMIILNIRIVNLEASDEMNDNQLFIDSPREIYEDTEFYISVYTIINNTPYYQIDTIIIFNNETYTISYNEPELIIKSPMVNEDTNYKIKAIKNGYISDEKNIIILNNINNKKTLVITILEDNFIVKGNTYFSLLITNEKGIPITNATVGIQNYISKNSIDITDEKGRARLFAPNNCDEIIILAQKKGYINATDIILIDRNPLIIEKIIQNPYTIILFSVLILILAIIVVTKRKIKKEIRKHNVNKKNYNIKSKKIKPNSINEKKIDLSPIKEAKVEEIRIHNKDQTQKIINLKNKNITNHQNEKKIQNKNIWFEGIDEIRYKIDKLTENVDSINENNWFEGKDNLRSKINEKLKKNKKIK